MIIQVLTSLGKLFLRKAIFRLTPNSLVVYETLSAKFSSNRAKETRMKAIEDVDVEKLVTVCGQVNEVIDNKIEVVGVATVDLIKSFTAALESMPDEDQDKVPDAVDFYNDLYKDEQVGEPPPPTPPPPADPPAADEPPPPTPLSIAADSPTDKDDAGEEKKTEKKTTCSWKQSRRSR
jgi:hypothetical protein